MTNQEAIDIIENGRHDYDVVNQALELAVAALEKQEPKAPPEISWDYDYFKCPSCGKMITSTTGIDAHKYCLECGQALKWEEKNENSD